MRSSIGSA